MIVKITTYRDTGKWYDDYQIEIPDSVPCFMTDKMLEAFYEASPGLKDYYFTAEVMDDRPGFWYRRMHRPDIATRLASIK